MKTIALFLLLSAILIGCAPNVQVVTLRGTNVRPADDGLVLTTDTLTLRYDFASERGQMHITVLNKLNQPLYIDWQRSSFIIGQDKIEYWQDIANVQLAGSSYGNRYSRYSTNYLAGTISKDDKISFIPPQTKLEKRQFVIVPGGTVPVAGMFETEQEPSTIGGRRKPVEVAVYKYAADQSPLTFRNYLTLSTDKDFKTEFHVDTQFWASDIRVLPRDQILYRFNGDYSEPVPFKKPDSFYVTLPVQ